MLERRKGSLAEGLARGSGRAKEVLRRRRRIVRCGDDERQGQHQHFCEKVKQSCLSLSLSSFALPCNLRQRHQCRLHFRTAERAKVAQIGAKRPAQNLKKKKKRREKKKKKKKKKKNK